jgi:pimeloyl-ACP methyl ester carboxylesterase
VRITLIGYSGGGVLALLIASRLDAVDQVITVAANLDVEAWAAHHAYSPLAGSLNPAVLAPLPARVHQLHLAGARDRQVPPATVASFLARNPAASFRIIEGFDHRCCWIEQWPEILALSELDSNTRRDILLRVILHP